MTSKLASKDTSFDPIGEGDSNIQMTGVLIVPVKGQNLVLLRVLKSNITTVRIIPVPFRLLSRKKKQNVSVFCCLKLVPLKGKNIFEPCLSSEILVPLGCFSNISENKPRPFYIGGPPPVF